MSKTKSLQIKKKVKSNKKTSAPQVRKVRPDELKWTSIELPDRMDDYEGFYGLEEIDGVDIVKDETTGLLSYQTSGVASDELDGTTAAGVDEEEFEGFSDDDTNTTPTPTAIKAPKRAVEVVDEEIQDTVTSHKQKKQKTKKDSVNSSITSSAFAAIHEADSTDAEGTDISAWRTLDLSPDTLAALSRLKFASPTPIQSATIPEILAGRDVIGKASTGSGKTLAFGIPIFETHLALLHERKYKSKKSSHPPSKTERQYPPLALIVTPTRELAHQLATHLGALSAGLPDTDDRSGDNGTINSSRPVIATITGGLSIQKQQRILSSADIVIGTPGRLWEIMSSAKGLVTWLRRVQFLVLDEADRLLSKGNFKELEEVLKWLDQDETNDDENDDDQDEQQDKDTGHVRQTLVFSATFHKGLQQKLAGKAKSASSFDKDSKENMEYLLARLRFQAGEKPKYIDVNPKRQMAGGLKEGLVECAGIEKDLYLYSILLLHQSSRSLVFVNSISAVRRLVPFLQNLGLDALALHSQMPQKARLRSIERFSGQKTTSKTSSKGSILVATDVAARGLDIPHVQLVVHYHLPRASDAYVHRSGRTARAGEVGSSILICGPEEVAGVRRLVAKVHASAATDDGQQEKHFIRNLNIDRRVVARLKPRATLAKRLADVSTAHEKKSAQTELFKAAAEDLGVDYDSEEMEKNDSKGKRGRGAGRLKKEREARSLTKDEVRSIRVELNQLLKQRVNVGVSERYLTSGTVDIDQLLQAGADTAGGDFLGLANGAGLDD